MTFRVFLFSIIIFSAFFFSANNTFAATYYWVGNANGLTSAKANWHTSAKACDGAGNASAAPVAADTINYVSNCTASSTIDSALSVTNFTIAAGYTGTITQNAGITVTIATTYSQADGTYTATTGTFDDNGSLAISAGTFTPGTTALTITGSLSVSGTGNYNIGASATTTFDGALNSTVTAGNVSGIVVINKNGTNGKLTVSSGTSIDLGDNPNSYFNGYSASGGLTNNGTITVRSGTWGLYPWGSTNSPCPLINNGVINHNGSNWIFSNVKMQLINNASGTINYAGTMISIGGDFTQNGTFNLTGKTVTFTDGPSTISAPGVLGGKVVITEIASLGNLTIATGTSINLGDNPTSSVGGYGAYIINNGTIVINSGTWTINSGSYGGTILNNGTINHNGTDWVINIVSAAFVNNTSGVVNYPNGLTVSISGSFTQNGIFDLTGKTLTFTSTGNSTLNCSGVLPGKVVITKGNYTSFTLVSGCSINLGDNPSSFIGGYSYNITNNGTMTVNSGTWTINSGPYGAYLINNGTIIHNGSTWNITLGGNFTNNGTTTFSGSVMDINGGSFINATSGVFNFPNGATTTMEVNFTNTGIYNIPVTHKLIFDGNANTTITAGALFTSSTIVLSKSSNADTITTIASGTTINLGNSPNSTLSGRTNGWGGRLTNNGTILVGTGTWTISQTSNTMAGALTNNSTIISSGSAWDMNYTDLINNGTITYPGATINIESSFTQNGTFDLTGKTVIFDGLRSSTITTANSLIDSTTTISKSNGSPTSITVATGTIINLGNSPTSNLGGVSNQGGGYFTNNGTILVGTGTWALTQGSANTLANLTNNGTITSSGTNWTFSLVDFINNGTTTYSGTAISLSTNFTQRGNFDTTGKTITFNGTWNSTVTYAGVLPGTVVISKSSGGVGTSFTVATGTTISLGNSPSSSLGGTTNQTGSVLVNNGTIIVGTGTWTLTQSSANTIASLTNNGTITSSGSGWVLTYIDFINRGTITYSGTTLSLTTNFTQQGTFNTTGKTITFNGAVNAVASTTGDFAGSIILNKTAANTLTFGSNMTVQDFTLTSGTLANVAKTLTINGDLVVTPAASTYFGGASLSVIMASSSDQNITITSGTVVPSLNINKTGGRAILQTNYTGSGAAATITVNSGALYLNGKTLSATTTVNNGGELQIQGNETFTTPTLNNGSTFTYVGDGNGTTTSYFINSNLSFHNLKINSIDDSDTFSMSPTVVSTPLPTSTISGFQNYWKGDGNANDSTGTNNGTFNNSATTTAGKYNSAFSFIGASNSYISIPNNSLFNFGNGGTDRPFSVSTWVYANTFAGANGGNWIINKRSGASGGDEWQVLTWNTSGVVKTSYNLYSSNNASTLQLMSSASLVAGQWYNVVYTYDGSKSLSGIHCYVNGLLSDGVASLTGTYLGMPVGTQPVVIGKAGWANGYSWNGLIDDVRIYNRALTPTEVTYLYAGSASTNLTLSGSLTVSQGIFSATTTNLIMSGASSTISLKATTTLASLTAGSTTVPTTLNFGTTGSLIITGTTTLQGTSTMPLTLRSITPGESWHFTPDGPRVLGYLDVQDSYNHSTDINAMSYTSITNSGHNTGWTFSNPTLTIGRSGTQLSTTTATSTDVNLGGAFTLTPSGGDFTLSALKLHQAGSFPIEDISDIKVYYEATSTCSATKPVGLSFATSTTFNASKIATTTFYSPLTLSAGSTTCLYLTYSLSGESGTSTMGRTIDLEISSPPSDVGATGGSITPTNNINIKGVTMIPVDNDIIVPSSPVVTNPISVTNDNCSSNAITSLLSLSMPREAKNPTLYYLQNCAVYKQVGTTTARRISPLSMQVHDLSFEKMSGGFVRMSITTSNMDPGEEGNFLNVTRTLSTGATIKAWRGE